MAVDANILIFERLKEEIRAGKEISKALEDGFNRAWLSIRDSNVSSLITTVILYIFGTPSIKGFAVTLGVGILLSMFTAITVTKTFLKLFVGNNVLTHPWLFGVSRSSTKSQASNIK
jgi:preprotein translocase subunit SecD